MDAGVIMKKKVTHEQAYKAMKKIRKYCKQTKGMCSNTCIFYDEFAMTNTCILFWASNPEQWETKPWAKKIKKNLAEVLKNE